MLWRLGFLDTDERASVFIACSRIVHQKMLMIDFCSNNTMLYTTLEPGRLSFISRGINFTARHRHNH